MNDKELLALKNQRAKAIADARAIAAKVTKEKPELSSEDRAQYDAIMAEANKAKVTIDREEELRSHEADLKKTGRDLSNDLDDETEENRSKPDTRKDPRATDEYRSAYGEFLMGRRSKNSVLRTHQVGSDIGGGFLVAPTAMVADLIKDLDNEVFIRKLARKVTGGPNGVGQPSLDTDFDDFDWTTELATGDEDEIELGQRESKPYPMAKRVKISRQLAANSNIEALIRERLVYKLGVTQEKAYLTGNGQGRPLGVFTASADGISTGRDFSTGNAATEIRVDGLLTARGALKAQHRRSARWLFHRDAVTMISKLKDGNGQYLWQPSVQVGQPDVLLGIPVDESEYVPNTFTSGSYVGLLANWQFYQVLDSLDLQIQLLNELYAETNQIGLIARYEGDGMPILGEAFARVKLA